MRIRGDISSNLPLAVRFALAALMITLPLSASGQAAPITSAPSTAPEISPAATAEEALKLTHEEQLLIADTHDGSSQLDEPGFYVLLRHAAMLPEGAFALDQADLVRTENLLKYPQRYRAQLVRVDVLVWRVTKWQQELTNTQWWGQRPIWRLDCTSVVAGDAKGGLPLIVLLTQAPADLPEGIVPRAQRVEVAGLFYKTVHLKQDRPEAGGAAERDYPVVVTNSLYVPPPIETQKVSYTPLAVLAVLIGLLIVGWLLARRYASRRGTKQYHPLRHEIPQTPPGEQGQEIDPQLQREIEEYRKRHGEEPPK